MRIHFERSGGFHNIHFSNLVDTALLTADQSAQLERLMDDAHLDRVNSQPESSISHPDRFAYELTVEREREGISLRVREEDLSPELARLFEWLEQNKPN